MKSVTFQGPPLLTLKPTLTFSAEFESQLALLNPKLELAYVKLPFAKYRAGDTRSNRTGPGALL